MVLHIDTIVDQLDDALDVGGAFVLFSCWICACSETQISRSIVL